MATICGLNIKLRNEHLPRAESFYQKYTPLYISICVNMSDFLLYFTITTVTSYAI